MLYRINPATNSATRFDVGIALEEEPNLAAGLGSRWVKSGDGLLGRVDPVTGRVVAGLRVPGLEAFAIAGDSIWAAAAGRLLRIVPV